MKVRITEKTTVKLGPLSRRTYEPAVYEITDPAILAQLEGKAEIVPPEAAADLRPDQVAALAAVADNVLASAAEQAAQALLAADLDEMKVGDLRELAKACGIATEGLKKPDLVETLAATRQALQQKQAAG